MFFGVCKYLISPLHVCIFNLFQFPVLSMFLLSFFFLLNPDSKAEFSPRLKSVKHAAVTPSGYMLVRTKPLADVVPDSIMRRFKQWCSLFTLTFSLHTWTLSNRVEKSKHTTRGSLYDLSAVCSTYRSRSSSPDVLQSECQHALMSGCWADDTQLHWNIKSLHPLTQINFLESFSNKSSQKLVLDMKSRNTKGQHS